MMQLVIYLICATLFCLAGNATQADPIRVRSGAHEGFTRLVLDVPKGTEWSVSNTQTTASVTISGHADGFNVNGVFSRIDKTYVERLESASGTLKIYFSCACKLSAFKQGDKMVVLDISRDPDAPPESASAQPAVRQPSAEPLPFQFGSTIDSQEKVSPNQQSAWKLAPFEATLFPSDETAPIDLPEPNGISNSGLVEAQQKIARQVGAAATRGLLNPKERRVDLPLIQIRPQIELEIFDSSQAQQTEQAMLAGLVSGNLRVTSSSDIPVGAEPSVLSTTYGVRCLAPEVTAIENWAADQPFVVQIAARRNDLFSEFDKLDRRAAVKLAQTYLHYGFGVEVREVLDLDPQLKADNPVLLEMSEIMEYGYVRHPAYLHNFVECDTDIALWAILSKPSISPETTINTSAALRAVTALPMHLREFIAPELSRRFLDYGEPDSAAAALRSLERAKQTLSADADLAKAEIEMAEGNVSGAQDRLERVVTSNVEQSAEALIKFVDSHLEADGQIEEDVATLVEAYALQMRDDPIGDELKRTHVLALGKSGQFNAAFDALKRIRDRRNQKVDHYVTTALLGLLTRNASDVEFLDHVFRQMPSLERVDEPALLVGIADRLVGLGFAVEAEQVLALRSEIPNDDASRLARARIALALSRPFEAEALIFGLQTPQANVLRAEAKAQSGSYEEAHTLFAQLGQEEGSQRTAWLSSDWISLVGEDMPVLGDVARVAQTVLPDDPNPDGMIARTNEAIAESAEARSVIEKLIRVANLGTTGEP